MERRFLVDTDVFVDLLQGSRSAIEFFRAVLINDQVLVSLFSYGELYEGVLWGRNPQRALFELEEALNDVEIIPISEETMRIFAQIRGTLRKQGSMIGLGDIIIGATVLELQIPLITRNIRHFARVPELIIINPANPATYPQSSS
jgi:predicted nucleic acid-binding protein